MSSILVQVIVGGLLLGAVYALFSSGLTLIWGMMNIVNFAHGDFVMLGMYVAFVVWTLLGVGPFVGAPVAALVLATLGVIVYFGLIRSVMKGPMLAQILGTFGLALLLRYSVFWGFGANFMTLPENLVGGTYDVLGIKLQASRLLAGIVALLVTLGLHLLLTRTSLGSKMLAVAEDATAAQLMGIRPDSMQAIAWAIAAGATGLAGALIATFFYIAPTVGETLGIVAFVTVSLGGFGSVPGALAAGLLIGVIEFGVGLLDWRGIQGHRGVLAVPVFPLVQAAGLDGQDVMRRFFWPLVALALVVIYPLVFTTPFQQRLGALILLYAIAASAWNIVGGYAGQVSVGHVVFFGCGAYAAMGAYAHFALSPLVGIPAGIFSSVLIAAVIGVPTLRLSGHYFSMATIAVAELARLIVTNTEYLGAAVGLSGPTVPRNVFDLSFISALPYYYLFLTVLLITLGITWWMTNSRMGFYLRAIKDFRTRRALARRARQPHETLCVHAERRPHQRRRCALCDDVRLRRSRVRPRHPDLREDADHGGARRRRPFVRAAGWRGDPGAAGGNLQQSARRQGRGADLRGLRRHHRHHCALPARRYLGSDQPAMGEAQGARSLCRRTGSTQCSLMPATSPKLSAVSRPSTAPA